MRSEPCYHPVENEVTLLKLDDPDNPMKRVYQLSKALE